ncbi:MAG: phosphoribosylformylglycinamidine synthase subunit PurL [Thermoguttaceae bacterium]|jgi:phosphoribosylformylglycinamidine synthase|nr:phosphoribosylformylglycinamidine synthase subunit PurL [Thermoguttaceae bacterium]
MLWEVDIYPADGQPDLLAQQVAGEAPDAGLPANIHVRAARGYLVQGAIDRSQIDRIVRELLADPVVERTIVAPVGDPALVAAPEAGLEPVHVLPKPGVMDPVAQSVLKAIADFGISADAVRTLKKYWIAGVPGHSREQLYWKLLANDAVEQVVAGPLPFDRLEIGEPYRFERVTVPLAEMDDAELQSLSLDGQLFLSLAEMQTIRDHFREQGRDPTDVELETLAQTWSEHCSHKTLAGRIRYRDSGGERVFANMLRETIFAATDRIRRTQADDDWCVSVFADNAGVVRFDDDYNVVFKVETHNHPSALEPYGGANTGIGGVIRDTIGTGMGAKPICNTDVFCVAPPDTPSDSLPPGVLHPRRVLHGVVAGVRDYGNRMGIPTVNGALYFDPRYLGNPLVYCGSVGIIPRDKSFKNPQPDDFIVAVGGRTGRDGIHGATFSSAELTSKSDELSGGAVQIGDAITEKMLLDVVLEARDRGLYNAITDCGAGGFSSAVGEMGEKIGAEVFLERVPLKYEGLSYMEMWISEAQERMVLAVPEERWPELKALCNAEDVDATVIGRYVPTGRLRLSYEGHEVADLSMQFLHDGRPPVVREAVYAPPAAAPFVEPERQSPDYTDDLLHILASLNVCSKHWIVRQYDHEVQGGSVVKPLVGAANDGPSDAAVVRPRLDSRRGLVIACGMNPRYGDLDTYWMAASAIDEAVRNCVAVGADPRRIAILDNFCWGNTDRPETLGSLVRAALACHDLAVALGTPFISGKDSLNNEFCPEGQEPISIPPSLLISAMGQVADASRCVTMDLKCPGSYVYLLGLTRDELGGSHFALIHGLSGGEAPKVDAKRARELFEALHGAMDAGLVRACHDLSEGGLAAAAAEMALAGRTGMRLSLSQVPHDIPAPTAAQLLFSESNSRFLVEVAPEHTEAFAQRFGELPCALVGEVIDEPRLEILDLPRPMTDVAEGLDRMATVPAVEADLDTLRTAWQEPLDW